MNVKTFIRTSRWCQCLSLKLMCSKKKKTDEIAVNIPNVVFFPAGLPAEPSQGFVPPLQQLHKPLRSPWGCLRAVSEHTVTTFPCLKVQTDCYRNASAGRFFFNVVEALPHESYSHWSALLLEVDHQNEFITSGNGRNGAISTGPCEAEQFTCVSVQRTS